MCEFEQKVLDNLVYSCGCTDLENLRIGAAVSGGADSISLLLSLSAICKNLSVITVNHNIRPKEETAGDAEYVASVCKKINDGGECKVTCKIVEFAEGLVEKTAAERSRGIEDAARFLRYNAFESFICENNLDVLCLAHNENDQLETLLMRFLNGSSVEASAGIMSVREKYIRPLLNIQRLSIEDYLKSKNVLWCTDSTNYDTSYLRNKIRLELVPFLNDKFPFWQKSIISGAEKNSVDGDFFNLLVERFFNKSVVIKKADVFAVEISYDDFFEQHAALQNRILLKACSVAGENQRIPAAFLEDFRTHPTGKKIFHNVEISVKNNTIFVKKYVKTHTESMFSAIIEESGDYEFPFGNMTFASGKNGTMQVIFEDKILCSEIKLPCCLRSSMPGDEVKCSDGKLKKIVNIFSDWHIPLEQRCNIPVLQELSGKNQDIICIFGSVCGFKDWIVYEKVNN